MGASRKTSRRRWQLSGLYTMGRSRACEGRKKGTQGRGDNRRKGMEAEKHKGAQRPASVQAVWKMGSKSGSDVKES